MAQSTNPEPPPDWMLPGFDPNSFGPRLGLTCFSNPIPDPLTLNSTHGFIQSNLQPVYWFTIDSLLIYLSFYQMIVLRWSVADALHPISHLELQPFRDAGYSRAYFKLTIQNVLFGVKKAIDLRLLKLEEFDLKEYKTFDDFNGSSEHADILSSSQCFRLLVS
ncbi:cell division control protein 14 [Puccinia graminis f. sp. tritici]|uniref:Cell division control protein 14 n=1 Tax=Puccinia graminis f. sp. tritici TaxID=56615 RepID=A0A5B0PQK9_PUCGR|nr:cell division control protein 14 [Puccinia graminis f. sp. tritici]